MGTRLRGGEDVGPVLDGPGAQQAFPVGRAGRVVEGGWDGQHFRACLGEAAVQVRKAHIVTDGKPYSRERCFGQDCALPGPVTR